MSRNFAHAAKYIRAPKHGLIVVLNDAWILDARNNPDFVSTMLVLLYFNRETRLNR